MNTEMNDKLDLLIAFSATDCGNDDVEMFKNLDTSGVTFSEDFYVKQRRLINKYKRKPALILLRKCFVRVAVVLMAMMSIAFLTAMATPNVRNAIFDAVVEWYDDHISVRFEPNSGTSSDESDTLSSSEVTDYTDCLDDSHTALTPPDTIEKVMKPSYAPKDVEEDIVTNNRFTVVIDYYLGDDLILSFTQALYDDRDKLYDNKVGVSHSIEVNGYRAVVLELESNGLEIIWTDGVYYYDVYSTTIDLDELIKVASSVQ